MDVGMREDLEESTPDSAGRAAGALSIEPCFPYGDVKRIRFEEFRSGSRSRLSLAPQALLNEVERN